MLKDLPVDEVTRLIGMATAPAFLLGAVVALLSLLIARLTRTADLVRSLLAAPDAGVPTRHPDVLRDALRRTRHTRWAIVLCVLSGIVTGWMVVLIFVDALLGYRNSRAIALAFILAIVLFTTALVFLLVEIRLSVADVLGVERRTRR